MPSVGVFSFTPAISAAVAMKSTAPAMSAVVLPAFTWPGHWTIIGTRMPPSYMARLMPVTGPLASKKPTLFPPSLCGPLSDVKKMIVFSLRP